ncbi:MAG TPA: DUF1236 domain-containing protein [Aestuariivirgaceae bacterium]|nr:DUF1236 domain-containing protein [Aestuariivirgaceae bacterium]
MSGTIPGGDEVDSIAMTNAFPKLLTALGAAAFLFVAPVAAQDSGAGVGGFDVVPSQDFDDRVTPDHRTAMSTTFRGMGNLPPAQTDVTFDPTIGTAIPGTVQTYSVPDEILGVSPDVRGYEYVTLPDGRIALVHPEDRTIAAILD